MTFRFRRRDHQFHSGVYARIAGEQPCLFGWIVFAAHRWMQIALCAEMRDDSLVSTVAEIKEAIARLSPQEYCELMAALRPPLEDDEWDKQMKADAEAGRLDFIDREIEQAKREGTLIPLEKILAEDEARE